MDEKPGSEPRRLSAIPAIHLDRRYRTADVISCIRDLEKSSLGIPRPNRSAVVRAQEVALASGAPDRGPALKVILMPSQRGGVIVVFVLENQRHFTVCELNNRTTLYITGRDWTRGAQSVTHAEAIERIRALRS